MKNLMVMLLTAISFTAFGQYTHNDDSFQKTYTQIRTYEIPEGETEWFYANGDFVEWTFHFNIDFFACPGCSTQRGVVMEDASGEPQFFMNYLGDLREGEDEYGEYGAYKVDVLSKDDETGRWKWWDAGECRYYGNWTMLYLKNPSTLRFDYFNVKN